MGHAETAGGPEFLRARAAVARALVKRGALQPEDALAFAVWPTPAVLEREQRVKRNTIASRAFGPRMNR